MDLFWVLFSKGGISLLGRSLLFKLGCSSVIGVGLAFLSVLLGTDFSSFLPGGGTSENPPKDDLTAAVEPFLNSRTLPGPSGEGTSRGSPSWSELSPIADIPSPQEMLERAIVADEQAGGGEQRVEGPANVQAAQPPLPGDGPEDPNHGAQEDADLAAQMQSSEYRQCESHLLRFEEGKESLVQMTKDMAIAKRLSTERCDAVEDAARLIVDEMTDESSNDTKQLVRLHSKLQDPTSEAWERIRIELTKYRSWDDEFDVP